MNVILNSRLSQTIIQHTLSKERDFSHSLISECVKINVFMWETLLAMVFRIESKLYTI